MPAKRRDRRDPAAPGEAQRAAALGLARGSFDVPESFFEPLPEEVLVGFEGR